MKNIMMSLLTLGFATSAMAAEPKIMCQMNWFSVDENGITKEVRRMESVRVVAGGKGTVVSLNGFEMRSYLRQVCATDGGPCSAVYELMTTIKKGDVSTSTNTFTPFSRQYLNLAVGSEIAFTLCDTERE